MRLALAASLMFLAASAPALAETNVGVAAAVNQQASAVTGGNIRTISLGESVIFNEHIQTDKAGLVQVLLADGTTFMVGPNSDLTIDKFVYDPGAGTAQVTASFTKGVLRFIGGQTSKTPNGVTINSPVGTMGIRGAMVDIVLDPPAGTPPHIDMLFGTEVTLEQGQDLLGRLYAAGYSLVLGSSGQFEVFKTPPTWGSQIQAALAGGPNTRGGAPKGPSDGDVKSSDAANRNSGNGVDKNTGSPLTPQQTKQLLEAVASYDELRDFIVTHPQGTSSFTGGVIGVVTYGDDDGLLRGSGSWSTASNGETGVLQPSTLTFDGNGNPVNITVPLVVTGNHEECGEEGYTCGRMDYIGGDGAGVVNVAVTGQQSTQYVATDAYLKDHTAMLDPNLASQLDCETCDAMVRWGFWGFKVLDATIGDGDTQDIDFKSTWITGDMTTPAQLNNLATNSESNINAYYSGDAIGLVHNADVETDYTATGDLDMTWNFGQRAGSASISHFDTEHFSDGRQFDFALGTLVGQSVFAGPSTNDYSDSDLDGGGNIKGSFVNNGNDVAAGVMGDWRFDEVQTGDYDELNTVVYSVGGVFMGEKTTLH